MRGGLIGAAVHVSVPGYILAASRQRARGETPPRLSGGDHERHE
jgi:hypothetical protein